MDDLFSWALTRPCAEVVELDPSLFNRRTLAPEVRAELELRRELGIEPQAPVFRLEEGVEGSRWYRTPTDNDVPWLTSRPRRA
jgi:hypothetical protein